MTLFRSLFKQPQKLSGDSGDCIPHPKGFLGSDLASFGTEGMSWGRDLQLRGLSGLSLTFAMTQSGIHRNFGLL